VSSPYETDPRPTAGGSPPPLPLPLAAPGTVDAIGRQAILGVRAARTFLAALLIPPLIGIGLIVMVAFDFGDSMLTDSPAGASAGLLVGALLILGSAALYLWKPIFYEDYFTSIGDRIRGGSGDPPPHE
jgi:hypothetical protein